MPVIQPLAVKKLVLDVRNFRTVAQPDEISAVHALIAIEPEWFWALMESLIDDGYLPTENIIVLKEPKSLIVKEGNRRVAALKILHGLVPATEFTLPAYLEEKLEALPPAWKKANSQVPCTVYEKSEEAVVDKVVTLIHGKGEKAGRVSWNAVARARHNREKSAASEAPLDLLEKFLAQGKTVTDAQRERWAGGYPLSVLEEAMKRLAPRVGVKSAPDLAKAYPKVKNRAGLEEAMVDIGLKQIGFTDIRREDFGTKYGLAPPAPASSTNSAGPAQGTSGSAGSTPEPSSPSGPSQPGSSESVSPSGGCPKKPAAESAAGKPSKAHPAGDPKAVAAALRSFKPKGDGRAKLATLLAELKKLDVEETPHAFCFVLRSMFEVSAKAYCADHAGSSGPSATEANGHDKKLITVLKAVVAHLTQGKQDTAATRKLQGAITELANPESVLSVTSLNQLVHNPGYVISGNNVCVFFANIFPLLQEMNK